MTGGPTGSTSVVTQVVDGDTMEVQHDGAAIRVRVLGIDAPEIARDHKTGPVLRHGVSDSARALLLGKPVTLTSHPSQPQLDRYRRHLRYVDVAGADLGQMLVEGGHAREYHLSSHGPTQRTPSYLIAQNKARLSGVGLWGACSHAFAIPLTPCRAPPGRSPTF
jgi:micrococcal nuclease